MGNITEVLGEVRRGAPGSEDELFRLVHGELRRLAGAQMRGAPAGHTLQPTALVNEAWIRLMRGTGSGFAGRSHFFGSAARAMRLILVDFARARGAAKRGGERRPLPLPEDAPGSTGRAELVLAVDEALERLERVEPMLGRIVELRFFAGLGFREAAEALGVSERTAHRAWEQARAWLYGELAP